MNPGLAYWWIFHTVSLILASVFTVIVGLAGHCLLKPGKMVRTIFPYIKRNDTAEQSNNSDTDVHVKSKMFGLKLSNDAITLLFFMALRMIFYSIWIFFSKIFIIDKGYNNPYSIVLNCFYDNGTLVEISPLEQITITDPVWCYAINTNIAGAAGQATGALAMAWLISSTETWIIIKIKLKFKKTEISNEKNKIKAYICYLLIILTITTIAIIIIWTNRKFFTKEACNVFLLENIVILIIPFEKLIPLMCIRNLVENTNRDRISSLYPKKRKSEDDLKQNLMPSGPESHEMHEATADSSNKSPCPSLSPSPKPSSHESEQ